MLETGFTKRKSNEPQGRAFQGVGKIVQKKTSSTSVPKKRGSNYQLMGRKGREISHRSTQKKKKKSIPGF